MKRCIYTKVDDFLLDDDFIRYAMDPSSDKDAQWASYLSAAPGIRAAFLKAYNILTHLDECELLSPEQVNHLKERVFRTLFVRDLYTFCRK